MKKTDFAVLFLITGFLSITILWGCSGTDKSPDSATIIHQERTADPVTAIPERSSSSIDEISRGRARLHMDLMRNAIARPLIGYYNMHGAFPDDIEELLRSGLVINWPADILTGKPYKIVNKLNPESANYGELAYVKESDTRAYFEVVVYAGSSSYYTDRIVKFPSDEDWEFYLDQAAQLPTELKSDINLEDAFIGFLFENYMSISQWARKNYSLDGVSALNLADIHKGLFFWIEENMAPDYLSTTPDKPGYFEMGWARLDGYLVSFYRYTARTWVRGTNELGVGSLCHTGNMGRIQVYSMDDLPPTVAADCSNWHELTDKVYIYSTERALNRTLDLPSSVVISIDDILEK